MKRLLFLLFFIFSILNATLIFSQKSYCHTDYNGEKYTITLMDGGIGKLTISKDGNTPRAANLKWTITNNRFPNPEKIIILLSTGTLEFDAINSNPPYGTINMLIDTKGNQYLLCRSSDSYQSSSNSYDNKLSKNYSNSSNEKTLRNYSWAKAQAEKEAEEIKKRNNKWDEVLERFEGKWVNSNYNGNGKNYMIIEKKRRFSYIADQYDYVVRLYIEYSRGNRIVRNPKIDGFSKINVETQYVRQNPDGDHLFYNEFSIENGDLKLALVDDKIYDGASLKRIEVKYGNFQADFGEIKNEEVKALEELIAEMEIKKLREKYGKVQVSIYGQNGNSINGDLYFKGSNLVYSGLEDLNLAVLHKNNSEYKFKYDPLLKHNGSFDIKIEPEKFNFIYNYNNEKKKFFVDSEAILNKIRTIDKDELRNLSINIITKDFFGEIKENMVYLDLGLTQIEEVYSENSVSNIIYPLRNEGEADNNNEFSTKSKENILKNYLEKLKEYSKEYFIEKKWLKSKKQEIEIKANGEFFINSDGEILLRNISTNSISNLKIKQSSNDIILFNNYLRESLNNTLKKEKLVPSKYLIELLEGSDTNGNLIINSTKIPVDFEFKHEYTFKILK